MKKVEAILRPEKLRPVQKELEKHGYPALTVAEVMGRGNQRGITLRWRVGEYRVDFIDKIKIEVIVEDEKLSEVVDIISSAARTGDVGDGKIFVLPVDDVIRIRTAERGEKAI